MTRALNVVVVINSPFPKYAGGRERWISQFLDRLSSGDRVLLLTRAPRCWKKWKHPVDNHNKSHRSMRVPYLLPFSEQHKWTYPFFLLDYLFFGTAVLLLSLLKMNQRVSWLYLNPGIEAFPLLFGVASKSSAIFTRSDWAREFSWDTCGVIRRVSTFLERHTYKNTGIVFLNGWDTQRRLVSGRLLDSGRSDRVKVVPNGIDPKLFREKPIYETNQDPSRNLKVCVVSTLRSIKRTDELVQSIPFVLKKYPQVEFVFAGKGDPSRYMRGLKELRTNSNVRFLGHVEDVPNLLRDCDISLCFSGGTGVSNALLESLAAGCAVIAHRSPIYIQLIEHEKTGLLSSAKPEKIAYNICRLIEDRDLRIRLAENGRHLSFNFSIDNLIDEVRNDLLILQHRRHARICT
jgi:glycosyltransferase involved in cell wall biosynthesis